MSTPEQIAQNRQNAQSSTGPITPEGKAISSQNAVKHGFFAKNDVISGEDPAAYEEHRQDIYDEYFPGTPTESVLTQRIASLTWRLMRADRLQTTTINTLVASQQSAAHQPGLPQFNIAEMIKTLRLKDKDPEYDLTDAQIILAGLAHFKNKPITLDPAVDAAIDDAMKPPGSNPICDAEIQLGTVIYNDFHGSGVIERLQGYEQKIENSLCKTIRLLNQLQKDRTKEDAARDKRDWQHLRAEDQADRNRRDDEYVKYQHHEQVGWGLPHREPNNQETQTEPDSTLTSISDITYNRSRSEKNKTNNPSQPPSRPNRQ